MARKKSMLFPLGVLACFGIFATVLILFLATWHDNSRKRLLQISLRHPVSVIQNRLRLRTLNVQCLLKMYSPLSPAMFEDADVIVFQEAFRKPHAIVPKEPLANIVNLAGKAGLQITATSTLETVKLPKVFDSGLACVGLHGNQACFVAFMPFASKGAHFDVLANKGVGIFDINRGQLRVATVHLQASYNGNATRNKTIMDIRLQQFLEAIRCCEKYQVDVLAGDLNTSFDGELDRMISAAGLEKDQLVPNDGRTTAAKSGISMETWDSDPLRYGQHIDHVIILRPRRVKALTHAITRRDVSKPWTDHAAVDVELQLLP
jgi:hypothetical protein